ncbi:Uncharacterised protein [Chlamydia abortus]|nr:Uncharacterised protein [Chlamydia abortus]SGA33614.1 Uncharacterised protein [Chlamydia abortus]
MLAYIIENYQDTYNIYYKGHPGHNDNNSFIESVISQGEEIGYNTLDDLIFVYNKDKATSQETFYVEGITNNFNDVHNY